MEQSPSWEANRSSASQEIARILWNPKKFHYRVYKSPPPVLILSQFIPVHAPHSTSWISILILSSHLYLGLPSGLFPSGFPTKPCIHLSSHHKRYMTRLSHSCHLYIEVKTKSSSQGVSCPFLKTSCKFGFVQKVSEYMNKAGNLVTPHANKTPMIRQKSAFLHLPAITDQNADNKA